MYELPVQLKYEPTETFIHYSGIYADTSIKVGYINIYATYIDRYCIYNIHV